MFIDGRLVELATNDDHATSSEVGWFAAKQPGLLRFLEDRLGCNSEALGVGVDLCWRMVAAFERHRGAPMQRLRTYDLEVAEEEVVRETRGNLELADGCSHRQPELSIWLAKQLESLPQLLDRDTFEDLVLATFSCLSATDRCFESMRRADLAS